MSRFDKYSQAVVGIIFVLIIFFFGFKTTSAVRAETPEHWSRAVINDYYDTDFEQHDFFIDMNGAFRAAIGTRVMRDADPQNMVFKLANGKLSTIMAVYDMYANMNNTVAFSDWLTERDIDFLYVMPPTKNSDPAGIMPAGVHDYSDLCMDVFKRITEAQFPIMDLREEFKLAELDWDKLYFDTDHHWTPRTAFWVTNHLLEYLTAQGALDMNPYYTDIENYHADVYEQLFLGSLGKRVGKYFAGVDDFEFIYPDFATDFNVHINKIYAETDRSGDFMDSIVYQPMLEMTEEHLTDNHYGAYFGGDYAEVVIKNNKVAEGKVLLIKDSFALPMAAFMSCAISELRMLDFRYLTEYDLEAYIEDYQPDAVLVMYSPSVLGADFMYKFLNDSKID